MGHHQRADQPGRDTPGGRPDILPRAFAGLILHLERPGEVLAQVVRGPALQGLAVLHQRLDGVGAQRPRELLAVGLDPGVDGDRHLLLGEAAVDLQDEQRLLLGLRLRGVRRVTLLPEELRGAQEQPGTHLPAHHVRPLIDQDRQVAIGADPLGVHGVDNRLRGGADDERLLQLLAATVRDHGEFGSEPRHVLGFLMQERLGDEQREIGVLVSGLLEPRVQLALHRLPHGVSERADDHAALDGGVVGHLGLRDHVGVPARVILFPRRDDPGHALS